MVHDTKRKAKEEHILLTDFLGIFIKRYHLHSNSIADGEMVTAFSYQKNLVSSFSNNCLDLQISVKKR